MTADIEPTTGGYAQPEDRQSPRICSCMVVYEDTLRRAIRDGHRTIEQLSQATRAGTCCQTCRPELWLLIEAEGGSEP